MSDDIKLSYNLLNSKNCFISIKGGNQFLLKDKDFGLNAQGDILYTNGQSLNVQAVKDSGDSMLIECTVNKITEQGNLVGGKRKRNHRKVKDFYNAFYQQIPQQYVQGFKDFFTYDPKIDADLMYRYAQGEYSQKFGSLYSSWKDELDVAMRDAEDIFNINYNTKIDGGLEDNPTIDFTQQTPAEKNMILNCFNKDPQSLMNIRNEELETQVIGGDKNQDMLDYGQLRNNYQIQMSENFIDSFLNGGESYTIQSQTLTGGKRRKRSHRRHRRAKYVYGGFGDVNIEPLQNADQLIMDYPAPDMNLAENQMPPIVNNLEVTNPMVPGNQDIQQQGQAIEQQILDQQKMSDDYEGGRRRRRRDDEFDDYDDYEGGRRRRRRDDDYDDDFEGGRRRRRRRDDDYDDDFEGGRRRRRRRDDDYEGGRRRRRRDDDFDDDFEGGRRRRRRRDDDYDDYDDDVDGGRRRRRRDDEFDEDDVDGGRRRRRRDDDIEEDDVDGGKRRRRRDEDNDGEDFEFLNYTEI